MRLGVHFGYRTINDKEICDKNSNSLATRNLSACRLPISCFSHLFGMAAIKFLRSPRFELECRQRRDFPEGNLRPQRRRSRRNNLLHMGSSPTPLQRKQLRRKMETLVYSHAGKRESPRNRNIRGHSGRATRPRRKHCTREQLGSIRPLLSRGLQFKKGVMETGLIGRRDIPGKIPR